MAMADIFGENIQKEFGRRVRELRLDSGVSQEDLVHICQLDLSYVGQIERGERNVSLINIYKLARGLSVPPEELLMPTGSHHSINEGK